MSSLQWLNRFQRILYLSKRPILSQLRMEVERRVHTVHMQITIPGKRLISGILYKLQSYDTGAQARPGVGRRPQRRLGHLPTGLRQSFPGINLLLCNLDQKSQGLIDRIGIRKLLRDIRRQTNGYSIGSFSPRPTGHNA
jgi:hypothetical protein